MTWKTCATPPERDGLYEIECRFPDGEYLSGPEYLRWEGDWVGSFGLQIMPYDVWREVQ